MISADPVDAERQSANARMRSYGLVSTRPSDVSSPDGTRQGLSSQRVVGRHVLRNSLIPVVTFIGVNFGFLLGGAIVTETIFNIPGVGRAVFDGGHAARGRGRRRHHHGAGHRVPARQPAGRPALLGSSTRGSGTSERQERIVSSKLRHARATRQRPVCCHARSAAVGGAVEYLTPAIEDRAVVVQELLADAAALRARPCRTCWWLRRVSSLISRGAPCRQGLRSHC